MSCKIGRALDSQSDASYTRFQPSAQRKRKPLCWGICCLRECIFGVLGMTYILLVLPAGVLVIFYGVKKNSYPILGVGCAVLAFPSCVICPSILLCRWRYLKKKDTTAIEGQRRKGFSFENELTKIQDAHENDEDIEL